MNEHSFIRAIHRLLPKHVYRWKINDNFAGGVADAYYSGVAGDLWIEYKFVSLPKRDTSKVIFGASAQQIRWLCQRKQEGRRVYLVVGSDEGCLIVDEPDVWRKNSVSAAYFRRNAVDRKVIVDLILSSTTFNK
jgi:hypothetical protein